MALTTCPECGHQVSDRATTCPSCGFPLEVSPAPATMPDSMSDGTFEFAGTGRFVHEAERRPVTVRWLPDRRALSVSDGGHSMLPATRLDDLTIGTDGSGTYEIRRLRGSVKPIEFTPHRADAFAQVASPVYQGSLSGTDVVPRSAAPGLARDGLLYVGTTQTRWAVGLIFFAALLFGLATILYVASGGSYADHIENPPGVEDPLTTAQAADGLWAFGWVMLLVAGAVFLVWFNKAYKAIASRGPSRTRWSSGWAVGGWFIPFANLVIPKLVMNEVDRVSNPANGDPPVGETWSARPRLVISDLWWAAWILATIAAVGESVALDSGDASSVLPFATAGAALLAVAGALLGSIVLTIGTRLAEPRTHLWDGLGQ